MNKNTMLFWLLSVALTRVQIGMADQDTSSVSLLKLSYGGAMSPQYRMHTITNGNLLPFSFSEADFNRLTPALQSSVRQVLDNAHPWTWNPQKADNQVETDDIILSGTHDGMVWRYRTSFPDEKLLKLMDSFERLAPAPTNSSTCLRFVFTENAGFSLPRQHLEQDWFEKRYEARPGRIDYHVPALEMTSVIDWLSLVQQYDYWRIQNWWFDLGEESIQLHDASFDELPPMPALVLDSEGGILIACIKPRSYENWVVSSNRIDKIEEEHITYPSDEKPFCLVCKHDYSLSRLTRIARIVGKNGYSPIFVESRWREQLPATIILNVVQSIQYDPFAAQFESLSDASVFVSKWRSRICMDGMVESDDILNAADAKNAAANELFALSELPDGVVSDLSRMFASADEDVVWRDYCLQFLGSALEREDGVTDADRALARETLVEALDSTNATFAGTALRALHRGDPSDPLVASNALRIARDPAFPSASRTTALLVLEECIRTASSTLQPFNPSTLAETAAAVSADSSASPLLRQAAEAVLKRVGSKTTND